MKKYLLIVLFCSLGVYGYANCLGCPDIEAPVAGTCGAGLTTNGVQVINVYWDGHTKSTVQISCTCACNIVDDIVDCKWHTFQSKDVRYPLPSKPGCFARVSCDNITFIGCDIASSTAGASHASNDSSDTHTSIDCTEGDVYYELCGTNNCGTMDYTCVCDNNGSCAWDYYHGFDHDACQYLTKPTGPGSGAGSVIGTTPISGGETIGGVSSSTSAVSGGTTGSAGTTGSSTAVTQQQGAQQNTTQSQGY